MKILLSLCIFFSIVIGNAQQDPIKGYQINGNIKNLPAKLVFIRIMKKDPKDNHPFWPKIDSAKVINGKFILSRDSDIVDPAWASSISYIDTITRKETSVKFSNPTNGKLNANFILENAKILIEGDVNNKDVSITGSKETDFFLKYGLIFPTYEFELNPKIDSIKKANDATALNEILNKKKELQAKFKADFRTTIVKNSSVHLALLNLYQNSKSFTPKELEDLVKLFNPSLLKTELGKNMLNYIQQSKLILPDLLFPDFTYNDPSQKKMNLSAIKGEKGTIIVFWASWCGPCRHEIPELKKLYAKYHAKGINMVSISIDHNINDWKKALEQEKMPWTNLSNLPGNHKEISSKFNIKSIPSIYLIDGNNKIILADYDLPGVEYNVKLLVGN